MTAGDMTKTALILIRNKLLEYGIKPFPNACIKLINAVHDEISLESNKEFKELASIILKESMEKAGLYFCKKVNMSASPVISNYWTH